MASKAIVLVGDAPVEVLIYPVTFAGDVQGDKHALQTTRYRNGAALISHFLDHVKSDYSFDIYGPLHGIKDHTQQESVRSILELEVHKRTSASVALKSSRVQHLDRQAVWHPSRENITQADIIIIKDTEGEFANGSNAVDFVRKIQPGHLLYMMARPLAAGAIWDALRYGPFTPIGISDLDRLVIIVSANDLRAEGIQLSHGLSWEKTCDDFVEKLGSVGRLVTLVTARHLIVLFGCDGVIYHQGGQYERPMLYFDPKYTEGEFIRQNMGDLPGLTEAFVAGLAAGMAMDHTLEDSIEFGLSSEKSLACSGLVTDALPSSKPEYPAGAIMGNVGVYDSEIFRFSIPSNLIGSGASQDWSILDRIIGDPAGVARRIVKDGALCSLSGVPIARFGRLLLVDRNEIQAFRIISNILRDYIDAPQTKPISIALFGSRGSGKAFAAMEVGATVLNGRKSSKFYLQLSQFTEAGDLATSFRSIRDCNLEGNIPLVYIDGFDTLIPGTQNQWLSLLLAPMLHGKFPDHGEVRPLGPAIFFLGSTNFISYEKLRNFALSMAAKNSRYPDFLSGLHGYINMLGPDSVSESDRLYPVRRAIILREFLEEREPGLKVNDRISIDDSVLDGLLLVPSYRQGVRSLKSIISMSRLNGCRRFEKSALPPAHQLDLHVDQEVFMRYLNGNFLPGSLRELLAEKLHARYLQKMEAMGYLTDKKKPGNQPWDRLGEEFRESARAHADDIPRKLRLISCFLSEKQDHRDAVEEFRKEEIEILAQNEHDRWNAERLQKQWSLGHTGSAVRTSSSLVAWCDLGAEWQDVDRVLVASYPKLFPEEYKIYRMGSVANY